MGARITQVLSVCLWMMGCTVETTTDAVEGPDRDQGPMRGDAAVDEEDDRDGGPEPEPAPCVDVQSDPNNCGQCGHDCGGAACVAGLCEAEAVALEPSAGSQLESMVPLFVEGDYLYLRSQALDTLNYRVSLEGGAVSKVLEGAALRAYEGTLYARGTPEGEDPSESYGFALYSATTAEPGARKLVLSWEADEVGFAEVDDYAVGGGYVYTINWCNLMRRGRLGELEAPPEDVVSSGCNSDEMTALALDDTAAHAYALNPFEDFLYDVTTADGSVTTIAMPALTRSSDVEIAGRALYVLSAQNSDLGCTDWECDADVEVIEVALAAPHAQRSVGKVRIPAYGGGDLKVRGEFAYVGHPDGVLRFPLDGRGPAPLYTGSVDGFALSEEHAYIGRGSEVVRVAR